MNEETSRLLRNQSNGVFSKCRLKLQWCHNAISTWCRYLLSVTTLALLFTVVSTVLSSEVSSFRLMESSCFNGLPLKVVSWLEFTIYVIAILFISIYLFYLLFQWKEHNTFRLDWTFPKTIRIVCIVTLSIFPIGRDLVFFDLMYSCQEDLSNSTSKNVSVIGDELSALSVPCLVVCTTSFVIIHQFKEPANNIYIVIVLGVSSVSMVILWVGSFAAEVSDRSVLYNYETCYYSHIGRQCDQKNQQLDKISKVFTPLTIEYCILCLTAITEMWLKLATTRQIQQQPPTSTAATATTTTAATETEATTGPPATTISPIAIPSRVTGADAVLPQGEIVTAKKLNSRRAVLMIFLFGGIALVFVSSFVLVISEIVFLRGQVSQEDQTAALKDILWRNLQLETEVVDFQRCLDILNISPSKRFDYLGQPYLTTKDSSNKKAIRTIEGYFGLRIALRCFAIVVLGALTISLLSLKSKTKTLPLGVSDFVLLISGSASMASCSLSWIADSICLNHKTLCQDLGAKNEYYVREIVDYLLNMSQFAFQTILLVWIERMELRGYLLKDNPNLKSDRLKQVRVEEYFKLLPGLLLYLSIVNLLLWGVDSFYEIKSTREEDLFGTQAKVFGEDNWNFLTQLLYPPGVYFRFHSTMIFINALYESLSSLDEPMEKVDMRMAINDLRQNINDIQAIADELNTALQQLHPSLSSGVYHYDCSVEVQVHTT